MLEEFEKSVKATLYDRLASPLIGSYVTAWCIFNYKVILIIFSDLQYTQKSEYIDALFAPWWNYPVRYGFPLLWSAFYVFCYPAIAKFVFRKWQKYIKDKRDIKHEIEGTRLLTLAESEEIRTKYLQSENKIAELMQNSENELKEWKDRCNLLLNEKQQLKERLEKYEPIQVVLSNQIIDNDLQDKNENQQMQGDNVNPSDLTHEVEELKKQLQQVQKNQLFYDEIPSKNHISREAKLLLKKIANVGEKKFLYRNNIIPKTLYFKGKGNITLDKQDILYFDELCEYKLIARADGDNYIVTPDGFDYLKKVDA